MRILALFLFLIIGTISFAQRSMYDKKNKDIWPNELNYKNSGWYLSPGFTTMLSRYIVFQDTERPSPNSEDEFYDLQLDPKGKFGLYFEFGRYHILRYGTLFNYLDYGLAYKSLRGRDTYYGELKNSADNSVVSDGGGTGDFGQHFATAHFNLNNITTLSSTKFLQNTLGLNADYAFIDNYTLDNGIPGLATERPGKFVANLHYKFGFGFKAGNTLIIPSIETPLMNLWPFNWNKSTWSYFYSKQRPLIISVRFLFFNKKGFDKCIPVPAPDMPDGYKIPTDMERTR